jgi:hypothetical protein
MSDGWASEAAARLRSQRESRKQENAVLLEHSNLRKEQGPELWNDLRKQVEAMVDSLNAEYGQPVAVVQCGKSGEFIVRLTADPAKEREMKASFAVSTAANALNWYTSGHKENSSGKCSLVIQGGKVVFGDQFNAFTVEMIATSMLDALVLE